MRWLKRDEYDAVLFATLADLGLPRAQAAILIAARWPILPQNVASEAAGRGLVIRPEHVDEYLDELCCRNGKERLPTDEVAFLPVAFDDFLAWCVRTGRAELTKMGELLQEDDRPVTRILRAEAAPNN